MKDMRKKVMKTNETIPEKEFDTVKFFRAVKEKILKRNTGNVTRRIQRIH